MTEKSVHNFNNWYFLVLMYMLKDFKYSNLIFCRDFPKQFICWKLTKLNLACSTPQLKVGGGGSKGGGRGILQYRFEQQPFRIDLNSNLFRIDLKCKPIYIAELYFSNKFLTTYSCDTVKARAIIILWRRTKTQNCLRLGQYFPPHSSWRIPNLRPDCGSAKYLAAYWIDGVTEAGESFNGIMQTAFPHAQWRIAKFACVSKQGLSNHWLGFTERRKF